MKENLSIHTPIFYLKIVDKTSRAGECKDFTLSMCKKQVDSISNTYENSTFDCQKQCQIWNQKRGFI